MNFFFYVIIFFIISCSKNESNYFPLEKIKSWHYKIEIIPEVEDYIIYKKTNLSLGKKKIIVNETEMPFYPILREDGTILYYQVLKSGVFRNGIQFIKDQKINFEEKKRLVIPYPLEIGKKWDVESKTFLILRRYPYYDYRATTNFKLNYEVISKNERIKTPLGTFDDCLLIKGYGSTNFIGDSEIGAIQINIISEEWYAKDVGLIKVIRTEKTDTELFGTTKMVQLLENFEK